MTFPLTVHLIVLIVLTLVWVFFNNFNDFRWRFPGRPLLENLTPHHILNSSVVSVLVTLLSSSSAHLWTILAIYTVKIWYCTYSSHHICPFYKCHCRHRSAPLQLGMFFNAFFWCKPYTNKVYVGSSILLFCFKPKNFIHSVTKYDLMFWVLTLLPFAIEILKLGNCWQ